MRRLPLVLCLLLVGCAAPPASNGLWSAEATRREQEAFRLSPSDIEANARAVDFGVAASFLEMERARVARLVATCPDASSRFETSPGIALRDAIRLKGTPEQREQAGWLAVADWRVRRAAVTGERSMCALAQQAVDGRGVRSSDRTDWPTGEVARAPESLTGVPLQAPPSQPSTATSNFALGVVDDVRGPAPLPAQLAVAYGGSARLAPVRLGNGAPEVVVDTLVATHADIEPDALLLIVRTAGE